MIQITSGPFFKTSGFVCTVNFDFASLYLRCLVEVYRMQGMYYVQWLGYDIVSRV